MQRIIFIEPINVLNSPDYREELLRMNNGRYSESMEEDLEGSKIELLKQLLDETGSQIVVCSDWRTCPAKMQGLMEQLQEYGIVPDQGIHSFMSFAERDKTKTESMDNHRRLLLNKDIDTTTVSIDSELNDDCMEGDRVFHTLQKSQGLTIELVDFVASTLGRVVDK